MHIGLYIYCTADHRVLYNAYQQSFDSGLTQYNCGLKSIEVLFVEISKESDADILFRPIYIP